jgi:hypothetical protein
MGKRQCKFKIYNHAPEDYDEKPFQYGDFCSFGCVIEFFENLYEEWKKEDGEVEEEQG